MMGALRLLLPLAWRNLWRNPRRTAITLAVVSVGLFAILTLAALIQAWAASSRDTALDILTGSGQIHAEGYLDDPTVANRFAPPDAALKTVLDDPAIGAWVQRLRVPAVVQSEYKTLPVTLLGVDPTGEAAISTVPSHVVGGRYLSGPGDASIVLGRHLADRLDTRIGKRVILMAQGADGTLTQQAFEVVGLFAGNTEAEDSYAFTGLIPAGNMLGTGKDISEISFRTRDDATLPDLVARLKAAAPGLDVQSWKTLTPLTVAIDGFMQAFVYIWLWVMFVFIAIGIVNTQLMAVFERVREFGLLKALGMKARLVLLQVILESALLIGAGVLIGLVASVVTIAALHNGLSLGFLARGSEFIGSGRVLYPALDLAQLVEFSIFVWILGVAVALWPARRAARSSPAEAMRHVT